MKIFFFNRDLDQQRQEKSFYYNFVKPTGSSTHRIIFNSSWTDLLRSSCCASRIKTPKLWSRSLPKVKLTWSARPAAVWLALTWRTNWLHSLSRTLLRSTYSTCAIRQKIFLPHGASSKIVFALFLKIFTTFLIPISLHFIAKQSFEQILQFWMCSRKTKFLLWTTY